MKENYPHSAGLEKLVKKYKKEFRIPENTDYYSPQDYKTAERKYIKHAVLKGEFGPEH